MASSIAANVFRGLRATFAPVRPSAYSYVEKNPIGMLGLVLMIGALPEIPLHHFLLPMRAWPFALLLDGLVVYSAAWVLGVYGIMEASPHETAGDTVVVHQGPFGRAYFTRADVAGVEVIENPQLRLLRRAYPEAGHLLVPGTDCVRVTFRRPIRVVRMFPLRRERTASEIFVSSDRPRELCALLGG